jgi:hypothetical protein
VNSRALADPRKGRTRTDENGTREGTLIVSVMPPSPTGDPDGRGRRRR